MAGDVSIGVLGPMVASVDGESVPLGGRLQRAVLADLVAHHPDVVSVGRLVADVWADDPPPSAQGTLYAYVSRLRKALGSDVVVKVGEGYRLELATGAVDAEHLAAAVREAQALADDGDIDRAAGRLRRGLDLWRGEPYGELGAELFLSAERARLLELRASALEAYLGFRLAGGPTPELVAEIEAAIEEHPFREKLWLSLMQALYRQGRQADALRAFRKVERLLGDEVGLEPGPELRELEHQILLQDPGLSAAVSAQERRERTEVPTNLRSAVTSFLGREDVVERVAAAVRSNRIVTLVGPGGVGKTRLAVETAWTVASEYPAGVWEVDLVATAGPAAGFRALAETLGVPERPGLDEVRRVARGLDDAPSLVLFDNCEHLIGELRPAIEQLIQDAPSTVILATSREPLGAEDEVVLEVSPLEVGTTEASPDDLVATPGVRLFEERARLARPGFRATPATAGPIAHIVERLDGLPLAIEIAAAQLSLLTLDDVAGRLDTDPGRMAQSAADPRHETLTSTIDWSYGLLDHADRARFLDLSVFAGPFTAENAADLWDHLEEVEATPIISRLVSKSLLEEVLVEDTSAHRYRMLETVREYCRLRLRTADQWDDLEDRYIAWVEAMAQSAADRFHDEGQAAAFATLRRERAEIAQAVRLVGSDRDRLRRLVSALWYWWYLDGSLVESLRLMDEVLSVDGPATLVAARALIAADRGADPEEQIVAATERALALASEGTVEEAAEVHLLAGDALSAVGRFEESEAPLLEAERLFREQGQAGGVGWALLRRVRVEGLGRGDDARARALLSSAVDHLEQAGDAGLLAYARLIEASIARLHGRWGDALDHGLWAVAAFRNLGLRAREVEARFYPTVAYINLNRADEARASIAELQRNNRSLGDEQSALHAAMLEAQLERTLGEPTTAVEIFTDLLHDAERVADRWLVARLCCELAEAHLATGVVDAAESLIEKAGPLWEQIEQPWFRAQFAVLAGEVALAAGRVDDAREQLDRARERNEQLGQFHMLARSLEGLAAIARHDEAPETATTHLAAATTIRDQIGAPLGTRQREAHRRLTAWCAGRLGHEEFRRVWAEAAESIVAG